MPAEEEPKAVTDKEEEKADTEQEYHTEDDLPGVGVDFGEYVSCIAAVSSLHRLSKFLVDELIFYCFPFSGGLEKVQNV